MAIGPTTVEKPHVQVFDRIRHAVSASVKRYFDQPLFYLFYTMLTATIIGLFFNREFPILYYGILLLLSIPELVKLYVHVATGKHQQENDRQPGT